MNYLKGGKLLASVNCWFPYLTGDNANGAQSRIGFKNAGSADSSAVGSYAFAFNLNEKHTLKGFVDGDVLVDGTKLFSVPKGSASSEPLTLFIAPEKSTATTDPGYNFNGRLYWMKLYKNGQVYRNYLPCKNDSDVVGLYETTQGTFISSASETPLTGGAEETEQESENE